MAKSKAVASIDDLMKEDSSLDAVTKEVVSDGSGMYVVGKSYLIRTVTMTQLGRVKRIFPMGLVLEDACWVASTGRFGETLAKGVDNISELEMIGGDMNVHFGGIIDACVWNHELPTESK